MFAENRRVYKKTFDEYKEKDLSENLNKLDSYKRNGQVESPVRTVVEREKEVIIKTREKVQQEMVKIVSSNFEPLKQIGQDVIGDLFDRVKFLRERIVEIEKTIAERREIHEKISTEIDSEISDRDRLLVSMSDLEKIREFKIDLTLLRMERRREHATFWRDQIAL